MRAFTDAATLSCHFIFLGIDWGKIRARGGRESERERERERGDWDYGKMKEWAPGEEERKVWEVFISLQVDRHAPTQGGMVPVQIVPEQITISFAVARSTPGLMALQCHISSKVSWNVCERHYREGGYHLLLINGTNLGRNVRSGTPDFWVRGHRSAAALKSPQAWTCLPVQYESFTAAL